MKTSMIIIATILLSVLLAPGCIFDKNDRSVDEQENTIRELEYSTYSTRYVPGNLSLYSGSRGGEVDDLISEIIHDDGSYISISGDCMSQGRGMILSRFRPLNYTEMSPNLEIDIINVTLFVNYKTCSAYNSSTSIEWSDGDTFENTTIRPENSTEEVIEKCIVFERDYSNGNEFNLTGFQIRYFNPQGGFMPYPIYFDFINIEVCYTIPCT